MRKTLLCIVIALMPFGVLMADDDEDNTFGGWFFTEVNHDFDNGMYVTEYLEYSNYQFKRMDTFFSRTSVGYKVLPWLKVGVNYIPSCNADNEWKHYGEVDVVGTLKSGNFKVSIRERYRHGFTGKATNELRSRLKVAYSIPNSNFGVYLAPEVFTWEDKWKKTRHYVACTYDITDHIQAEGYYMYYAFKDEPAEHVVGLGLNFDL